MEGGASFVVQGGSGSPIHHLIQTSADTMSGFNTYPPQQGGKAPPASPLDSISISSDNSSSDNSSSAMLTSSAGSVSDLSTASGTSLLADALQQRRKHVGPNVALSYEAPLLVERGEGCYLFDEQGRRYLDCVNNVAHVGHGNTQVAAAVAAQLTRVNTNSRYLSSELNAYCRDLTDTLPSPLQVTYLVNSGSEANDLALRIASAAATAAAAADTDAGAGTAAAQDSSSKSSSSTTRDHVVVMAGAYHGHLSSLIPLSPYKFWGPGGSGKPDWVHVIPAPDMYRGVNLDGAAAARAVLAQAAAAGGRVVAFFCESIISCGGQLLLPPGYLSSVYAVMRAAGVVCIADEVQTGFGRTGHVWGFQHQGVVPDIVTLGKPMGNGFPIAGVVTSPTLAAAFAAGGMEYFNTFGGCNAAVAAGRAVLRELRDRQLQEHAADVGRYMLAQLQQLQAQFPCLIGDVRGLGLFAGLELVTDSSSSSTSKTPAPLAAKALREGAKARGVLLSADGPLGHVIKVKPPMVFGRGEGDCMVDVMRDVLSEMTTPQAWHQLVAAGEAHHTAHVAPILDRYRANEAFVWEAAAILAVPQAAAAAAAVSRPAGGSSASLSELDCSIIVVPTAAAGDLKASGGPTVL